jgi:hypothetical protein
MSIQMECCSGDSRGKVIVNSQLRPADAKFRRRATIQPARMGRSKQSASQPIRHLSSRILQTGTTPLRTEFPNPCCCFVLRVHVRAGWLTDMSGSAGSCWAAHPSVGLVKALELEIPGGVCLEVDRVIERPDSMDCREMTWADLACGQAGTVSCRWRAQTWPSARSGVRSLPA